MARLAQLGMNTVVVRDCADASWRCVAAAARRHGLQPLRMLNSTTGPHPGMESCTLTDDERAGMNIEAVFAAPERGSASRSSSDSAALDAVGPPASLAASLPEDAPAESASPRARIGPPGAESEALDPGRAVLRLICDRWPDEEPMEAVVRWWRRFHAGLSQGLTGGLLFAETPGPPGAPRIAVAYGHGSPVEFMAAIKRIAARMRAWGPTLDRLGARPRLSPSAGGEGLEVTLFARDRRRFLLVANGSSANVLRSELLLDDLIDGRLADRVEEVPAAPGAEPGKVVRAVGGRISLPLEIGPGDAKLFEVFEPVSDNTGSGDN
jgi:hypothetical protein